jgi:hypothetical protein
MGGWGRGGTAITIGFLPVVVLDTCPLTILFLTGLDCETLGFAVTFFFIGQHQRQLIVRNAVLLADS